MTENLELSFNTIIQDSSFNSIEVSFFNINTNTVDETKQDKVYLEIESIGNDVFLLRKDASNGIASFGSLDIREITKLTASSDINENTKVLKISGNLVSNIRRGKQGEQGAIGNQGPRGEAANIVYSLDNNTSPYNYSSRKLIIDLSQNTNVNVSENKMFTFNNIETKDKYFLLKNDKTYKFINVPKLYPIGVDSKINYNVMDNNPIVINVLGGGSITELDYAFNYGGEEISFNKYGYMHNRRYQFIQETITDPSFAIIDNNGDKYIGEVNDDNKRVLDFSLNESLSYSYSSYNLGNNDLSINMKILKKANINYYYGDISFSVNDISFDTLSLITYNNDVSGENILISEKEYNKIKIKSFGGLIEQFNKNTSLSNIYYNKEDSKLIKLLTERDNKIIIEKFKITNDMKSNIILENDYIDFEDRIYKTYSVIFMPDTINTGSFVFLDPDGSIVKEGLQNELFYGKIYRFIQFNISNNTQIFPFNSQFREFKIKNTRGNEIKTGDFTDYKEIHNEINNDENYFYKKKYDRNNLSQKEYILILNDNNEPNIQYNIDGRDSYESVNIEYEYIFDISKDILYLTIDDSDILSNKSEYLTNIFKSQNISVKLLNAQNDQNSWQLETNNRIIK